ncbi:Gfo/Idh/MocA family oxidoreductase [Candidatus Poribacteria bacterium]|nr:Gfo/Idh/MocA family oxidoreductase [Candidatus Poribacteria bacterium]
MSKKYRVGIIGFAHMHINNVASLYAQHPQAELVACADTVPDRPELREAPYTRAWNLKNALTNIGVPKAYDDYHEMLKKEQFDIIICCSENAKHPEVVEACAAARANVCVEKPMAMSLSHALRMVRACQAAGTTMLINWPLTWSPSARKAKALIDEGVIGRVLEVKWRAGHTGPLGSGAAHAGVSETADAMTGAERGATWWHQAAAGGGALLDFSCYGAMVSRWYIDEPAVAAIGMKANLDSQWGDADDNGAMIVRFPSAMALLEGSWTTWHHGVPTGPIVYGTIGTLVVESRDGKPVVRLERGHGQTTIYESEPLPEGRQQVSSEFIHHLETGGPLHPTLEMMFNLEVMAILDAGVRSAESGKLEMVNSAVWQIG